MLDVVTGKMVDHPQITITDGRISAVGSQGAAAPADARHVDLPGITLLPGLIDMHVHLTGDPKFSGYRGLEFTDNFWTVVGVANAKRTVEAGFTTVRNVGSANYDDVALKQGIEQAVAKKLVAELKAAKLKVDAQIQGDKLRVNGKKRDDLQLAMALLRKVSTELPLQFENFRD